MSESNVNEAGNDGCSVTVALPFRELTIGQSVFWHRECRGLYAAVEYVPGIIKRIGKRVTIEVRTGEGGRKRIAVRAENISAANKPLGSLGVPVRG